MSHHSGGKNNESVRYQSIQSQFRITAYCIQLRPFRVQEAIIIWCPRLKRETLLFTTSPIFRHQKIWGSWSQRLSTASIWNCTPFAYYNYVLSELPQSIDLEEGLGTPCDDCLLRTKTPKHFVAWVSKGSCWYGLKHKNLCAKLWFLP